MRQYVLKRTTTANARVSRRMQVVFFFFVGIILSLFGFLTFIGSWDTVWGSLLQNKGFYHYHLSYRPRQLGTYRIPGINRTVHFGGELSKNNSNLSLSEEVVPVNPHNFIYQINQPRKCYNTDGSEREVFLLVVILTIHKNFKNREAIRQSWGSPTDIDGHSIITLFLLANPFDLDLQKDVILESKKYNDILMEDFIDTYKNLTLKTIMGMKWMSTFCRHAKYMMKTDDDMYVSYANLVNYLLESPDKLFVTGNVIKSGPIRNPQSKWHMPTTLYKDSKYPPFCSGTGYVLSGDVPQMVYNASLSTPYLYLEDVFVAICLRKLNIVPKNHKEFHNWRTTYKYCNYKKIITAHMVTPVEMVRYWKDQQSDRIKC